MTKPRRVILPLLKCPITDFDDKGLTISIGALYGSPTTIRVSTDTAPYDLRRGDMVTLYCEVLMKGPTDGQSS